MLVFEERGKPEYSEKTLSKQSREPTKNHIWNRTQATWMNMVRAGLEKSLKNP